MSILKLAIRYRYRYRGAVVTMCNGKIMFRNNKQQ